MATETVENYLKAIMTLSAESPTGEAALSRLAALVGVTRGTATSMVRKLAAARLATAERYGGISLTSRGRRAAADVLRRHRLIETFLVRTLHFDWSEVHDEAERLEHAVSPRLLERLDALLGHPETDPHGDPIPDADGAMPRAAGRRLSECRPGAQVRLVRVVDQSSEFLRYMARHGLTPNARARVRAVHAAAQSIEVVPQGRPPIVLGLAAAARILVEPAVSPPRRGSRRPPRARAS